MRHREPLFQIGERYVLQYACGPERLVRIGRPDPGTHRPVIEEVDGCGALPRECELRGYWLVGPRERLTRDADGRYWCVSARATVPPGAAVIQWNVAFARFTERGESLIYTADSAEEPALLPDPELASLLGRVREQSRPHPPRLLLADGGSSPIPDRTEPPPAPPRLHR